MHLGWHEQGDGLFTLGLSVENGRIQDLGQQRLRTGLRHVVERFRPGVRLTASQDILLTDLLPGQRAAVESLLGQYGIRRQDQLSNVRLHALACPALPTCGLALAESERVFPAVIDELEAEIAALGLQEERLSVRMTGCPNGCARPYVADIGFVGRSGDRYVVYVGGRTNGTRLNWEYADLVPLDELTATVRPLLVYFKETRQEGESFGDFCHRVGLEALHAFAGQIGERAYV